MTQSEPNTATLSIDSCGYVCAGRGTPGARGLSGCHILDECYAGDSFGCLSYSPSDNKQVTFVSPASFGKESTNPHETFAFRKAIPSALWWLFPCSSSVNLYQGTSRSMGEVSSLVFGEDTIEPCNLYVESLAFIYRRSDQPSRPRI